MASLHAVLTRDEFWCPQVVAIVRLLMLTGCRFGESLPLVGKLLGHRRHETTAPMPILQAASGRDGAEGGRTDHRGDGTGQQADAFPSIRVLRYGRRI